MASQPLKGVCLGGWVGGGWGVGGAGGRAGGGGRGGGCGGGGGGGGGGVQSQLTVWLLTFACSRASKKTRLPDISACW